LHIARSRWTFPEKEERKRFFLFVCLFVCFILLFLEDRTAKKILSDSNKNYKASNGCGGNNKGG